MFDLGVTTRTAVLAAAVALALGAGACGSNDDDGNGGSGGGATAAQPDGAGGQTDEAQIGDLLETTQATYLDGDGKAFCALLTKAGREQVETFGNVFSIGKRCDSIIAELSRRSKGLKQKPTKLISVEVDGDKAIAKVRDGGRPPEKMKFAKRGGEWKLPDPGFSTDLGTPLDGSGKGGGKGGQQPPNPVPPDSGN